MASGREPAARGLRVGVAAAPEGRVGPCPLSPSAFFVAFTVACGPVGGCWDLVTRVPVSVVVEERGWGFRGCEGAAGGQTGSFPWGLGATTSGLF